MKPEYNVNFPQIITKNAVQGLSRPALTNTDQLMQQNMDQSSSVMIEHTIPSSSRDTTSKGNNGGIYHFNVTKKMTSRKQIGRSNNGSQGGLEFNSSKGEGNVSYFNGCKIGEDIKRQQSEVDTIQHDEHRQLHEHVLCDNTKDSSTKYSKTVKNRNEDDNKEENQVKPNTKDKNYAIAEITDSEEWDSERCKKLANKPVHHVKYTNKEGIDSINTTNANKVGIMKHNDSPRIYSRLESENVIDVDLHIIKRETYSNLLRSNDSGLKTRDVNSPIKLLSNIANGESEALKSGHPPVFIITHNFKYQYIPICSSRTEKPETNDTIQKQHTPVQITTNYYKDTDHKITAFNNQVIDLLLKDNISRKKDIIITNNFYGDTKHITKPLKMIVPSAIKLVSILLIGVFSITSNLNSRINLSTMSKMLFILPALVLTVMVVIESHRDFFSTVLSGPRDKVLKDTSIRTMNENETCAVTLNR